MYHEVPEEADRRGVPQSPDVESSLDADILDCAVRRWMGGSAWGKS
jgi:hypothetical protein